MFPKYYGALKNCSFILYLGYTGWNRLEDPVLILTWDLRVQREESVVLATCRSSEQLHHFNAHLKKLFTKLKIK